ARRILLDVRYRMKKRSVSLRESDILYLEYVAKETGKPAGELMRDILEREVKKYKLVFGKIQER
ncbi:hypothetical protein, partial [Bacillus cereus group sp. BfR-BA-01423]|uniref:hypothetical protein n=1 Tax=Bacillus cereus group sp. BfR-BA-01423 TaxID=2920340 RepID=UPI001F5869EC